MTRSPLLDVPGAIGHPDGAPTGGPDADVACAPRRPLRRAARGARAAPPSSTASHRGVVVGAPAPTALSWLHLLLSQQVADLPEGARHRGASSSTSQGRVEHHAVLCARRRHGVWLDVEPGRAGRRSPSTSTGCVSGRRSTVARNESDAWAVLSDGRARRRRGAHRRGRRGPARRPAALGRCPVAASCGACRGRDRGPDAAVDLVVPRAEPGVLVVRLRGRGCASPPGTRRLRGPAGRGGVRPRLGLDTDERAIPTRWAGSAAPSTCRRAATAGRRRSRASANLGRPPRQLVLLHLQAAGDDPASPSGHARARERRRSVRRPLSAPRCATSNEHVALALLKRSAVGRGAPPGGRAAVGRARGRAAGAGPRPPSTPTRSHRTPASRPGRAAMRRLQG